ncbi:MAG: alpha/beta hydrolase [Pseudomonadota bacterium]
MKAETLKAGYADCESGQLHYVARRSANAGKSALVLLNPRSRSCRRLLPFIPDDRPVFIIDIPGLGMSSPPREGASMRDVAAAIAGFADALELGPIHAFGIHTGGKVAAALALHWPDKLASLIVCGKSHSIIPSLEKRNSAMKEQSDKPDSLIMRSEGRYLDEPDNGNPMARLYEANFRFDLAAAIAGARARTLIIEITSSEEDIAYGRQGKALADLSPQGTSLELAQTDVTGLDFYAGAARVAGAICRFID